MSIASANFAKARVLIVGDIMLDSYYHGNTTRISPEAPVPVLHVSDIEDRAGGAANVALNISNLGGRVKLLGFVGKDSEGERLKKILSESDIDTSLITISELPTINKMRVVGRKQQLIRLDFEKEILSNDLQMQKYLLQLEKTFIASLADFDLVIFSDYGKGTLSRVQNLIQIAKAQQKRILIDPKGKDFSPYREATLLTPNLEEFEAVVGSCKDEADLAFKAEKLRKSHDLSALLVTRGEHGMSLICEGHLPLHIPTKACEIYDVTGAGDTVIATLGVALAAGYDLFSAVTLANVAANLVVQKFGAAAVSIAELRCALQNQQQNYTTSVLTEERLLLEVADARSKGERIIMTNGCFDILHPGHISYLQQAKALGDRLIVAVNDDASVKKLKGAKRPINSLQQRMLILAALRAVDWVVSFCEETPARLISRLKPDILVKGGDYALDEIAGADFVLQNGGEVKIIPLLEGFSTRGLLEKLRR